MKEANTIFIAVGLTNRRLTDRITWELAETLLCMRILDTNSITITAIGIRFASIGCLPWMKPLFETIPDERKDIRAIKIFWRHVYSILTIGSLLGSFLASRPASFRHTFRTGFTRVPITTGIPNARVV